MKNQFATIALSVVPVRAEASDSAEQLTQLLFGESIEILEIQEKWIKVRCLFDDYQGWIDPKQCISVDSANSSVQGQVCVEPINIAYQGATPIYLSIGSTLPKMEGNSIVIGEKRLDFQGKFINAGSSYFNSVEEIALLFLNTPYLWGGRSIFGIDCSGLTQLVYKIAGVALKRDAHQQAEQGTLIDFIEGSEIGDLAFFDNEEGKIIHVGIIISQNRIIHASGEVRIDQIDHQGIFNRTTKSYSHKLRIIKRLR